ncbi:hypothetical protein [Rahnella sp. Larv3_ips]|uniref:hypothetical protein n=1 Tax=Rahnella sp. Larv3_ips TaxID=1896943 RepID=UPI000EFCDDE6|nr:hypothetical protein [Rahnella sp. Larv3_ips]
MKERPILFNAEMVKAILCGRKTQTRRVIKLPLIDKDMGCELAGNELAGEVAAGDYRNCPLGKPGDQLWVREAFRMAKSLDIHSPREVADLSMSAGYKNPWAPIQLEADGVRTGRWTGFDPPPVVTEPGKLRPSLHMPRWASRIQLEITNVGVQRLQDISSGDVVREGICQLPASGRYCINPGDQYLGGASHDAREVFYWLWDSIYGGDSKRCWQANPWVWVSEFKLLAPAGELS